MDRRAISLDETPFAAHRAKKTISDLVEMGFDHDLVKNLGEGDSSDFNLSGSNASVKKTSCPIARATTTTRR